MTYVVIAPEHPFAKNIDLKEVKEYIKKAQKKTEMERKEDRVKSGIFSGKYAINPANGEEVPIWISDYVLAGYGTGAIMAVPGHDVRDFEFAKTHNLPVKEVIIPKVIDKHDPPREGVKTVFRKAVQVILINPKDNKVLALKWKKFPWVTFITGGVEDGEDFIEGAKREIKEETGYEDVEYIKTLGGPVESHFYANHKKENRKALFSALVFHIKSDKQIEVSKEEFDAYTPTWMSFDELDKDKDVKCSEYEIWKDRLLDNPSIFTDIGVLINSGKYNGLTSEEAKAEITSSFKSEKIARSKINYHLRDWSISRQRYWGTPVPIIHCEKCDLVPVPLGDLPVELPYNVDYAPKGKPPLATDEEWLKVKCPSCGGEAKRDAETLDTFFDSAWYYYRYVSPHYEDGPFEKPRVKEMMPVDVYFGGSEHTLGHTLYARFFTKFFKDIDLVFFDEFAQKRVQHGVILGPDGNRMSKSRGNVVNPDDVVSEYGADAVRLYLCFMMPYEATSPWSSGAISGVYRFLKRVWILSNHVSDKLTLTALDYNKMHKTIQKVGDDLNSFQFNTAVASLMTWLNFLESKPEVSKEEYKTFLKLIAPFAPHLAEEIWQLEGFSDKSIHLEFWPSYQSKYLIEEELSIAVQVNGKLRDTIRVESSKLKDQGNVEEEAKRSEKVKKYLENQAIKKVIYIPGRLINFVI
jgi:leucyl-tRNA synthetase